MTDIRAEQCQLVTREQLPLRWAADLGAQLEPRLTQERLDQLHERVVSLDQGVMLAHIRTPLVDEPRMGAYKLVESEDDGHAWLWIVVLIPQSDASRHLGWMAHLAAGLHDQIARHAVCQAGDRLTLVDGLEKLLDQKTHRYISSRMGAAEEERALEKQPVAAVAAAAAKHRLIVVILKEESFVDDLLTLFVEHDVRGATVLEARGMAEHLAAHMSLFAGFRSAFKAVGHSQVVITVVPTDRCDEVLEIARLAAGGMATPGAGIAFALDVPRVVGLDKAGG